MSPRSLSLSCGGDAARPSPPPPNALAKSTLKKTMWLLTSLGGALAVMLTGILLLGAWTAVW